jgi:hypothetical protein
MALQSRGGVRTTPRPRRAARAHCLLHRADELEVVVVRIGQDGDPHLRGLIRPVWLPDHGYSSGSAPLELTLHVGCFDVPDDSPRAAVLTLHLIVRADRDRTSPDLRPKRLRDPRQAPRRASVVVLEALRILEPINMPSRLIFSPSTPQGSWPARRSSRSRVVPDASSRGDSRTRR